MSFKKISFAILAGLLAPISLLLAAPVVSLNYTSTVIGGDWDIAATWQENVVPVFADSVSIIAAVTFGGDKEVDDLITIATGSLSYNGSGSNEIAVLDSLINNGIINSSVDLLIEGDVFANGLIAAGTVRFDTLGQTEVSGEFSGQIILEDDLDIISTNTIFSNSLDTQGNIITLSGTNAVLTLQDVISDLDIESVTGGVVITGDVSSSIIDFNSGGELVFENSTITADTDVDADLIVIRQNVELQDDVTLNGDEITIEAGATLDVQSDLELTFDQDIIVQGDVSGSGDVSFNTNIQVDGDWTPAATYFDWEDDALAQSYEYEYATSIGDVYTNPTATVAVSNSETDDLTTLVDQSASLYIWTRSVYASSVSDWSDITSVNIEPNTAPVIETNSSTAALISIDLNEGENITISATTTDPDGHTITSFTTKGADEKLFNVVFSTTTVAITLVSELDFEDPEDSDKDNVYELVLVSTDILGETSSQTIELSILNLVNEPVFTNSATANIAENDNAAFISLSATEPQNQDILFTLDTSSDDASFFEIQTTSTSTAELSFINDLDYDTAGDNNTDNVYQVTVLAVDTEGNSSSQELQITATPVNEHPPVFTNFETQSSSTVTVLDDDEFLVELVAQDDDLGDTLIFSLATSTDQNLFEVDGDELTFIAGEVVGTYEVSIKVTDSVYTDIHDLTVIVLDASINYAPEFDSADDRPFSVEENISTTTILFTGTAFDLNEDDLVFSLDLNISDNQFFVVDENTGDVYASTTLDYENPADSDQDNVYEVTVQVTDTGNLFDTQKAYITVTDISEFIPVITSTSTTYSIVEGVQDIVTLSGTDVDGDTFLWSATGTDSVLFDLDTNSGELSFATTTDFSNPVDDNGDNIYEVSAYLVDNSGATSTQLDILVTVTDTISTSTGNGGGSSSSYVCRDETATNYKSFGKSDPKRCKYDKKEDKVEEKKDEVVPVVLAVDDFDETDIVVEVAVSQGETNQIQAVTSPVTQSSTENTEVNPVDNKEGDKEEAQNSTQAASVGGSVDGLSENLPLAGGAALVVLLSGYLLAGKSGGLLFKRKG